MINIQVDINYKNVMRNFRHLKDRLEKGTIDTVHKVTKAGYTYMRGIAPVETGALIQAITYNYPNKSQGVIISGTPNNPKRSKQESYNYLIETGLVRAGWHPKVAGKEQHFFSKTFEWLSKEFPKQMKDEVFGILEK